MKLAWTYSKYPTSNAEMWLLTEPCSHFVMVFEPDQLVFQSNFLGVGIDWLPSFLTWNTKVFEVEVPMPDGVEEAVFQSVMSKYDGDGYDWGGFAYFAWRAVLLKFLKRPLPQVNAWMQAGTILCTGLFQSLDTDGVPDWLRQAARSPWTRGEMTTPYELYQRVTQAQGST